MSSPDRCYGQKVTETPQEAPEQYRPENTSFPPDSQMIFLDEQASVLTLASRASQNEERTEEAPGFVQVRGAVAQVKNGIPGTDLQEQQYQMGDPNKAGPEAFATSILAKDGEDHRTLRDQRHNALMSIAHLPPEVLILVFHDVVEDSWSDIPELLHALLLVSKTWKILVEGTPSLWCRIALSRSRAGPGYLTTAPERSQNLLLT